MRARLQHFRIEDHGSIVLVRPLSDECRDWIDENVQTESWQWMGGALACEPRYVGQLVQGMHECLSGEGE